MNEVFAIAGWVLVGALLGAIALSLVPGRFRWTTFQTASATNNRDGRRLEGRALVSEAVREHFEPLQLGEVTISERRFPYRVRADLQRAVDQVFGAGTTIRKFCGVQREYSHDQITLSDCLLVSEHNPALVAPPQFEEVDIGEERSARCLKIGLWFVEQGGQRFIVLLAPVGHYGQIDGVQFQIATAGTEEGTRIAEAFFRHLEECVLKAESYRGKVLSLEASEHSYSGKSTGIKVHRLRTVGREQVILPRQTLDLLDRNVIEFVQRRPELSRLKQSTRKGILFYGPPGTGKTHTIHYLISAIKGSTTFLISADQVGLLAEYMTLARLMQPSTVIIEDADLIARERTEMGVCEEVLLNKLLNEMDGLKEDADILFILTTNRPTAIEQALASRPGRIDQAIEFPLPNEEGRSKLIRLYSQGVEVPEELSLDIVRRTEKVSAAFIKELMRRSVQFYLERKDSGPLGKGDVDSALDEMLFSGGTLNLSLLGAEGIDRSQRMGFRNR